MRSDAFGFVQMHSNAFGHFRKISKKSENSFEKYAFRNFGKVSEELEANGPQNQLPHQILLQIHLS